ncbi:MAG: 6,7-dimethyl-8-ribityllumazine synthase [archaeon]
MDDKKLRIGIVAAEFNFDLSQAMINLATEHAKFLGCEVVETVLVPGCFEIPFACRNLIERKDIDALVALGSVIEGATDHDELVAQHSARKIMDLSLEYNKPIGFGITGPGMSRLEGHQRIKNAKNAVEAAVKLARKFR